MKHVAKLLYSIIGSSLAGTFVVVALVAGADGARALILAAVLGFVLAVPVAILVARKLTD